MTGLAISIAKGTWLSHKFPKAKALDNLQLSTPQFKKLPNPIKNRFIKNIDESY